MSQINFRSASKIYSTYLRCGGRLQTIISEATEDQEEREDMTESSNVVSSIFPTYLETQFESKLVPMLYSYWHAGVDQA